MKVCTKCNQQKDESCYPRVSNTGRLRGECKDCQRRYKQEYYLANRPPLKPKSNKSYSLEYGREKAKRYYSKHREELRLKSQSKWANRDPEKVKERQQKWREENREKVRNYHRTNWKKYQANYVLKHPEYGNIQAAKRRAALLQAIPQWLSKSQHEEIKSIYKEAKKRILETGERFEVDHIEPLRGKTSCGLHVPWNLQILPRTENARKSNKLKEISNP